MKKQLRKFKRQVSGWVRGHEVPWWPNLSYPSMNLVYWQPKNGLNFGDELAMIVVQLMLAERGMTMFDRTKERRQMLAIGSVLHHAENGTVVWGTGRNGLIPDRAHFFDTLDVRAVRGPLTRAYLKDRGIAVPEVYGDPALLLPRLLKNRFPRGQGRGAAFVPNLNDFQSNADFTKLPVPLIDPRDHWNTVVGEILSYDFILASSLHGLILAEAFGIPARFVRFTEHEHLFKYEDYYAGTGREQFKFAKSMQEGLDLGGEPPPSVDLDLLANAFPYDLWTV